MKTSWMKSSLCAALVAAGCGTGSTTPSDGKVTLSLAAKATQPSSALAYAGGTCATFTFTPYSLAADGTASAAGAVATFTTTADPSGTVAIAGCLDTLAGTATDHTADDWEYLVTATDFLPCTGGQDALTAAGATILPASVYAVVKLNCQKGIDVAADVAVDVSVTLPNSGGYTDIGATVNETEVDVGCKTPDNANNTNPAVYNFGESWVGLGAVAPNGLWGHTSASGGYQQWSGQAGTGASTDQYYTGNVNTTNFGGASGVFYLLQTFVPTCPGGESYSGTLIPGCVNLIQRNLPGNNPGAVTAGGFPTLLQAFEQTSGGWAAASTSANVIHFVTSPATFNFIQAGSTPTAHVADLANNVVTLSDFPATGSFTSGTLQGIYPYQGGAGLGFVVTYLSSGAPPTGGLPSWATFEYSGAWTQTHSGTTAGTPTALLTCLGLYSTVDACYTPASCSFPGVADTTAPTVTDMNKSGPTNAIVLRPYFSEPVTINAGNVATSATLKLTDGTVIAGDALHPWLAANAAAGVYTYSAPALTASTTYVFTINPAVTDLASTPNPIGASAYNPYTFTTAAAGTAGVAVGFTLTEVAIAALAATGSVTVAITDSAGAPTVQFTDTTAGVLSAPASLGATLTVAATSFTVTMASSDAAQLETMTVSGLSVAAIAAATAASGTILGALSGASAAALTLAITGGMIPVPPAPPTGVPAQFTLSETSAAALAATGSVTVAITDSAGASTVHFTDTNAGLVTASSTVAVAVAVAAKSFTVTLTGSDPAQVEIITVSGLSIAADPAATVASGAVQGATSGTSAAALTLAITGGVITAAGDLISPTVLSANVTPIGSGVALDTTIIVPFSEAMAPLTITYGAGMAFTVTGPTGLVPGGLVYAANTLTFTPTSALEPSATYTAAITTAPTDLAGNHLAFSYSWPFTTAAPADTTSPTVISTSPIGGSTDAAVGTTVIVTFSEAMNWNTVGAALAIDGGADIGFSGMTHTGNSATFTPASVLTNSTRYVVTMLSTSADVAGNVLGASSWNFTTAAPAPKAITAFWFNSPSTSGTINEVAKTIAITVPNGTSVTALVASFNLTGTSATVGGTTQTSSTTSNDFTSPVAYVVHASDGLTATYTVTVTVMPAPANFRVFAGTTLSGSGTITGNLGVGASNTSTVSVSGTTNINDAVTAQFATDLNTAYNAANALPQDYALPSGELGGQNLTNPGVYKYTGNVSCSAGQPSFLITGTGNYTIQVTGNLTTRYACNIAISSAQHLTWVVGGNVDIGGSDMFRGDLMTAGTVLIGVNAVAEGKVLSKSSVTMSGGAIVRAVQ